MEKSGKLFCQVCGNPVYNLILVGDSYNYDNVLIEVHRH